MFLERNARVAEKGGGRKRERRSINKMVVIYCYGNLFLSRNARIRSIVTLGVARSAIIPCSEYFLDRTEGR